MSSSPLPRVPPPRATDGSARPESAGPVPSPCISVCRMDPSSGLCEGCTRTLEEIAGWGTMDDEGRLAVWARIARRRAAPAD
jgi:predicted Fe-S protein YdhL (DUF1289 family)